MIYLAAVGALCLLNLVLILGVIRRLRHHAQLLNEKPADQSDNFDPVMLPAGERCGEFLVTTVDAESISRESLADKTIVGFFTARCQPCRERVPQFLEHVEASPAGRGQSLAVVVGDDSAADELAASMAAVARVVREQPGGPMVTAFGVRGYPALCEVNGAGLITSSGFTFDQLRQPVAT